MIGRCIGRRTRLLREWSSNEGLVALCGVVAASLVRMAFAEEINEYALALTKSTTARFNYLDSNIDLYYYQFFSKINNRRYEHELLSVVVNIARCMEAKGPRDGGSESQKGQRLMIILQCSFGSWEGLIYLL